MTDTRDKEGWEHIVKEEEAGESIIDLNLSPEEADRVKIANLLGIVEVKSLNAKLKLTRVRGGMVIRIDGTIKADIVQECVVTLEPIESHIEESFQAWYTDPDQAISFNKARQQREMQKQHGEVPILEESDDPEPIIDGVIDVGDVVTQFLSLSIDPYAHKEGVRYEVGDDEERPETSPIRKNPFEKLKEWKDKQGS